MDSYKRSFKEDQAQCGCHWTKDPRFGDVLVECVFHRECTTAKHRAFMAFMAARAARADRK